MVQDYAFVYGNFKFAIVYGSGVYAGVGYMLEILQLIFEYYYMKIVL